MSRPDFGRKARTPRKAQRRAASSLIREVRKSEPQLGTFELGYLLDLNTIVRTSPREEAAS